MNFFRVIFMCNLPKSQVVKITCPDQIVIKVTRLSFLSSVLMIRDAIDIGLNQIVRHIVEMKP